MQRVIILLATILSLTACDDRTAEQKRLDNKAEYNWYVENCPEGYEVRSRYNHGYKCTRESTSKEIKECIKETTGYFKNLNGEFEDWDTSDIKEIIRECKRVDYIFFE